MKVKLVFFDWMKNGKSIYSTEEGIELSLTDFYSGTTFAATIDLDVEQEADLKKALEKGFDPVFYVIEN